MVFVKSRRNDIKLIKIKFKGKINFKDEPFLIGRITPLKER